MFLLLFGCRLLGCRFFGCRSFAVLAAEALNAARGIYQLLLTGEEWVATRANFYVNVALMRGARGEDTATSAMHAHFVVCRMNGCFHWVSKYVAEPFDSKGGAQDSATASGNADTVLEYGASSNLALLLMSSDVFR